MYWTRFLLIALLLIAAVLFSASAATTQLDVTAPTITPGATNAGGNSWCVARDGAAEMELQAALDYACGKGGADCAAIQPAGRCYSPATLTHHASYAFNSYYRKNPLPESCNFGGTAVVTAADPSSKTCQYPPTSTSWAVLNVTNPNSSTIFGARPSSPARPSSGGSKVGCSCSTFIIVVTLRMTGICFMYPILLVSLASYFLVPNW
uniref:X8 domain-containing protein n=1 Tax=Kalanchoe fedtschenkoi TaxID=63787 RepID=A0A7N0T2Z8_KALFE